ncbi:hypothetical protein [Hymenobacter yonginensis]|uniref:Type II toxin-antitoxin system PemK/MazF family toxin n=1 Tax=Hymenobacter yonginensis TaxID=748197 RepID=A0ABY7PL33_9BACT|nr:hypothetical protein [Hymenobacter yonginensis]WBO83960.1 hypothetical protein O9Z63_16470 [Hymenobacter yonginensis]
MKPTSTDTVRGKRAKYRRGDCLIISYDQLTFYAAFVAQKTSKHYYLTLIDYKEARRPTMQDFASARFFGILIPATTGYVHGLGEHMLPCLTTDADNGLEKVGTLDLGAEDLPGSITNTGSVEALIASYDTRIAALNQKTQAIADGALAPKLRLQLLDISTILHSGAG